jgi:SUMO ligase MMS21 Smc5/6 complex component
MVVQKAIKEKECYKSWHHTRSTSNMVKYKEAKKNARRVMNEARGRAYDELYERLGTKEGKKYIYKMAKIRDCKTRDLNQVKCIKDEANQLLVKDEDIMNRCGITLDRH